MTLLLRKSSAQAALEGWVQCSVDEDYGVLEDERVLGRIYADVILGLAKWRWAIKGTSYGPATTAQWSCDHTPRRQGRV